MTTYLKTTCFSSNLAEVNGYDDLGFAEWVFHPGMLFYASERWWGDGGNRDRAHEGLDFRFYRDSVGCKHCLDEHTKIPVMYDGDIVKIDEDFMGKSVYISHDSHDENGYRLCTIYSHTRPNKGLYIGKKLREGDIIATIAHRWTKKVTMPPHLHITVAWISQSITGENLDWKTINDCSAVILMDPLEILGCRYTVIDWV